MPAPRILGHETAGTLVKVGARVEGWRVGDRVALHHHVPCLDCHACRHGAYAQCPQYLRTGITAGFEPAGGGYAEYVRVMRFCLPGLVKIPRKNSFLEGAMLEPVNTVLKAVNRLNLLPGDTVMVAGQGPIGLMFTGLLAARGMRVVATDFMAPRRKMARRYGARQALAPDSADVAGSFRAPHAGAVWMRRWWPCRWRRRCSRLRRRCAVAGRFCSLLIPGAANEVRWSTRIFAWTKRT